MKKYFVPLLALGLVLILALYWVMLFPMLQEGGQGLSTAFIVESPRSAGRDGGIGPILISSLHLLIVVSCFTWPLGLGIAMGLSDLKAGFLKSLLSRLFEVLGAVPSIVYGLFGHALFCVAMGLGYSLWAGGLTLTLMVLPLFIRMSEEALSSTPSNQIMAAKALGLGAWSQASKIKLKHAWPVLLMAWALALSRALAETAALIFTSGYADRMPESWMDSGRSLSVHIYELSMNVAGGESAAMKSVFVLVAFIMGIQVLVLALQKMNRGWVR